MNADKNEPDEVFLGGRSVQNRGARADGCGALHFRWPFDARCRRPCGDLDPSISRRWFAGGRIAETFRRGWGVAGSSNYSVASGWPPGGCRRWREGRRATENGGDGNISPACDRRFRPANLALRAGPGRPGGPAQEVRVRNLAIEPPTMECAPPNAAHGICQEGLPAKRRYSPHQGLPSPATQSQTTISTVPIAERC